MDTDLIKQRPKSFLRLSLFSKKNAFLERNSGKNMDNENFEFLIAKDSDNNCSETYTPKETSTQGTDLNRKISLKKIKSKSKLKIKKFVNGPRSEEKTQSKKVELFLNNQISNSMQPALTVTSDLEEYLLEQKIQKKLYNMMYIYNKKDFSINMDFFSLSEKQKMYTTLIYSETVLQYECTLDTFNLQKLDSLYSVLYQEGYNIFEKIEDITPKTTRQVIRGLRVYLQKQISAYNGNKNMMETIFNVWDQFNTTFTFKKILSIENKLKVLFPKNGCSLASKLLEVRIAFVFNDDTVENNILDCFYSLVYLFLLNDGILFWDEYVKISKENESLFKILPTVISYDNMAVAFELLELLIFLIGNYAFKPFEEVIQYVKNFSLIMFSLENCLPLPKDQKFKDLSEFKQVTYKLSTATLILLEKYLIELNENNQLKDFYLLDKLNVYLHDKHSSISSKHSKTVLVLSEAITKSQNVPQRKENLVYSILRNLKNKKKFSNCDNYMVSEVLCQFLHFLSDNFKKFSKEMTIEKLMINEFDLVNKNYGTNEEVCKNLFQLMPDKKEYLLNPVNIVSSPFTTDSNYLLSDFLDVSEFSDFGKNIFSSNKTFPSISCLESDNNSDSSYAVVKLVQVENWAINCFQNKHPLIFPNNLTYDCCKIYELKNDFSEKLGFSFVYFNFLTVELESESRQNTFTKIKKNLNYTTLQQDKFNGMCQTPKANVIQEKNFQTESSGYSGKTITCNDAASDSSVYSIDYYENTQNNKDNHSDSSEQIKSIEKNKDTPSSDSSFVQRHVTPVKVTQPKMVRMIEQHRNQLTEPELNVKLSDLKLDDSFWTEQKSFLFEPFGVNLKTPDHGLRKPDLEDTFNASLQITTPPLKEVCLPKKFFYSSVSNHTVETVPDIKHFGFVSNSTGETGSSTKHYGFVSNKASARNEKDQQKAEKQVTRKENQQAKKQENNDNYLKFISHCSNHF